MIGGDDDYSLLFGVFFCLCGHAGIDCAFLKKMNGDIGGGHQ